MNHYHGFHIEKIMVFDESDNPQMMYDYANIKIPLKDLKDSIALETYKVEVRYVSHGQKFRYIFRNEDLIHFPIRKKLEMKYRPKIQLALIKYKDGRSKEITNRVIKYAGPNIDFNKSDGSIIFASDIIPFYDMDEVKSLHIIAGYIPRKFYMNDIVTIE
jgi:hypothetical protein